ncbi:hypothetical protein SUGI_1522170 [Cryptomeria japonica]|uniref:Uncharacterized protein n=1 Tax=Cryptomeria japonica TaxID=3369 RepID=A0AAD3NVD5_CRYJA|nr:hypothetical protein SUGI_0550930 [Cryptomeria japonica]GLJ28079.1 hypothetical protein SUGI_0551310 [Cryptomeria japonica]GLJ28081.1 hypothetical protein SUGI_0551340 [Cryptomeria japonica]GLJ59446.1 hypothetical protein SUGI_1509100 [Cryptomeria japonica]GLJ59760.1 hypothetical protein SUGI_1522170 [Cryptomeria japonica]
MEKSSVYKYIGVFIMLVWVLFEKTYAGSSLTVYQPGSSLTVYQQPNCSGPAMGVGVGAEACGCYTVPEDYREGYNFDYNVQDIAMFETDGCAGQPGAVLLESNQWCAPVYNLNSVYFYCF